MSRFKNKVALVSGASSGIGACVAQRIATEGGQVFGIGRDPTGLATTTDIIKKSNGTITTGQYDISNADQCRDAIRDCITHYGRIDVLINCAGRHKFRQLHEVTDDNWWSDIATNLGGTFFLSQAAIPELIKTAGNIVNVGSLASVEGQPYSAAYCSAKHGIVGLTRALALEFMKEPIRINAVCPGGTKTPQQQKVGMPESADFDLIMTAAGMREMAEPEDIAAVICFVASDDAKSVHGAIYMADNGKTT